jgi:Na+/H+ antiporter NhaD/arsenite permease-like protein
VHDAVAGSTTDIVSQLLVAALLISMFVGFAIEASHRLLVALGTVSMLWAVTYLTPYRLLPVEAASRALDLNVLLLLAAMMALVGVLKSTGVFGWAVERLIERFDGRPTSAVAALWWFTAVASAFVDNVTTVIFVVPIALAAIPRLGAPPALVLIPLVMAANIGGTATLVGDPPNIMIGSGAGLTFLDFIRELTLPTVVMMIGLHWWGVRRLRDAMGSGRTAAGTLAPARRAVITDPGLLRWMGAISAFVLVGFVTHGLTGMPTAVPALIGAAGALLVQDIRYLQAHRPSQDERRHGILDVIEREIEWPTLTFFALLFIVVGAAVGTGLTANLAHGLEAGISAGSAAMGLGPDGTLILAALLVLWAAALLSSLMDNIPFVAVSIPIIGALIAALPGDGTVLWWALALGACLGGNGTPIGASANVTTLGLAERVGMRISFREFTAVGARVTIFTLLVSTGFLVGFILLGPTRVALAMAAIAALAGGALYLSQRVSSSSTLS